MIERDDSVIVTVFVRFVAPLANLFALYVLLHGHYSPGGGFQAGVILGATRILQALALGREALGAPWHGPRLLAVAAAGALLYLLTGVAGFRDGGAFLDYGVLPLPATPVKARYIGILLIETGVTAAVAATLIAIFDRLAVRERR